MRIAWFRATAPDAADPLDDTAALVTALRSTHDIDVVIEENAHDFVWRHALEPYDLCVYELDDTGAHEFEWGYLLNYAGVTLLKSAEVQQRAGTLISREGRLGDYMTGFQIEHIEAGVASLRVPLLASRSVVVQHPGLAEALQQRYTAAHVRYAPIGVGAMERTGTPQHATRHLVVAAPGRQSMDLIQRAAERVRASGQPVEVLTEGPVDRLIEGSDVVVALEWPPHATPPTAAFVGMAAGKPVVALEIDATADWPALDPQTWRPRGLLATATPIAVTLNPLDEEHSLAVTMLRLAADLPLRDRLGRAGHAWWLANATPAHAATAWQSIIEEARSLSPPPRPADWPSHLDADGTELTRAILNELGAATDV